MHRYTLYTLVIFLIILTSCEEKKDLYENAIIIDNITIIDPVGGLQHKKSVIIEDNLIGKIYSSGDLNLSKKNKIIDGKGKFLIPGLWDSHVHFAYDTLFTSSMSGLFLAHGVTSVRDTGGEIDFVSEIKNKSIENMKTHVRVKMAGPLIDGKFNVYDGSSSSFPPLSIQNKEEKQLEEQVLELIDKGVDFLKAYEMLTPEQFKILGKIAQENGLKLTGHVPLSMDVIDASNLGLNSMEHMRNMELSTSKLSEELIQERKDLLRNEFNLSGSALRRSLHQKQRMKGVYSLDSTKLDEVVNVLYKNKTWQIPTLALYLNFAKQSYKLPSEIETLDILPNQLESKWKNEILESPISQNKEMIDYTDWSMSMVSYMHDRGIEFMAGTDTPIGYLIPGYSLHQEMATMAKSTMTNLDVLRSATYNPAYYFGMGDYLGRIASGYIADLIILDENPLENIENTKTINSVIKDGYVLNRKALDSIISIE